MDVASKQRHRLIRAKGGRSETGMDWIQARSQRQTAMDRLEGVDWTTAMDQKNQTEMDDIFLVDGWYDSFSESKILPHLWKPVKTGINDVHAKVTKKQLILAMLCSDRILRCHAKSLLCPKN